MVSDETVNKLIDKIAWLKKEAAKLKVVEAEMDRTGETQISETDPDARSHVGDMLPA